MADPSANHTGASAIVAGPFHRAADGRPTVHGVLHRPASHARDGLVLTHGAGGSSNAPLLVALGDAFSGVGVTVLRCDLPYRQARPKGPPFPSGAAHDRDGLRQAVRELRWILPGRVFLGGQSYGGRQASMLAADEPGLTDGLLLLSYPLHPPGRAQELRTDHFSRLRTPALFAHGSLDPFGSLVEIETARPAIAAPTAVIAIDGAGHGLGRGTRAPRPAPDTVARIVAAFLAFVASPELDAAGRR
jgi:predicted alpha/beta-hydrolase family hydrolase